MSRTGFEQLYRLQWWYCAVEATRAALCFSSCWHAGVASLFTPCREGGTYHGPFTSYFCCCYYSEFLGFELKHSLARVWCLDKGSQSLTSRAGSDQFKSWSTQVACSPWCYRQSSCKMEPYTWWWLTAFLSYPYGRYSSVTSICIDTWA